MPNAECWTKKMKIKAKQHDDMVIMATVRAASTTGTRRKKNTTKIMALSIILASAILLILVDFGLDDLDKYNSTPKNDPIMIENHGIMTSRMLLQSELPSPEQLHDHQMMQMNQQHQHNAVDPNNNSHYRNDNNNRHLLLNIFPNVLNFRDPKSTALRDKTTEVTKAQQTSARNADDAIARGDVAFRVYAAAKHDNDNNEEANSNNHLLSTTSSFFVPSMIRIEVINPKMICQYSVTVISHRRYTGTATLLRTQEAPVPRQTFSWEPIFPGEYEILVHEIDTNRHNDPTYETPLISPPFPILVRESEDVVHGITAAAVEGGEGVVVTGTSLLEDRIQNAIPCQLQQMNNVDIYSQWDGDWLGPDFKLPNKIRTGWTFVPSPKMNCKLETFSHNELQNIPKKKKIFVLGSSILRGVFLSMVDLLLGRREKEMLMQSVIGKCWGRAKVSKGNLELMYQDFRSKNFEDPLDPPYITCHNDKLAREPGTTLIANATAVWEEIFHQEDESEWPSVIYLLAGNFGRFWFGREKSGHYPSTKPKWENQVKWFVDNLPPTWRGTLFLNDNSFSARKGGLASMKDYESYLQEIHDLSRKLNDPRVRWIDGYGIAKEMRMHSEGKENRVATSQHFHRACNNGDVKNGLMIVCSNVTEMVAQLLLGHALGPKQDFLMEQEKSKKSPSKKKKKGKEKKKEVKEQQPRARWCHACPKCLVPCRIIPYPKMKCVDGPLLADDEGAYGVGCARAPKVDRPMCPKTCLESPVAWTFGTQSDTVSVRHCLT